MFLDDNFLLTTKISKNLYHKYAEKMPIIDYHCHLNPVEIYENKNFENLTEAWLVSGTYGDHYKWRLERTNGIPEKYITGDATPYEKFKAWAYTIEHSIGNPLYEWTHLELKRFFGIDTLLSTKTAPEIWKRANELLATDAFKRRNLIKKFNVKVVCTTDDPIDDLNIVGGGSNVALMNQLTATIAGVDVYAGPSEATAIGNIIVQMIAQGDILNVYLARRIIADSFPIKKYTPGQESFAAKLTEYQDFLKKTKAKTVEGGMLA